MSDLGTAAPITDEELAEAIRVRGYQVPNGIKVLQLILDHIPPETRRVPWNGQQDYYRNNPPTHAAPVPRAAGGACGAAARIGHLSPRTAI